MDILDVDLLVNRFIELPEFNCNKNGNISDFSVNKFINVLLNSFSSLYIVPESSKFKNQINYQNIPHIHDLIISLKIY